MRKGSRIVIITTINVIAIITTIDIIAIITTINRIAIITTINRIASRKRSVVFHRRRYHAMPRRAAPRYYTTVGVMRPPLPLLMILLAMAKMTTMRLDGARQMSV